MCTIQDLFRSGQNSDETPALDIEAGKGIIANICSRHWCIDCPITWWTSTNQLLPPGKVVTGTTPSVTNFKALFEQERLASAHPKGGGALSIS